ncbi:MAG: hypothetical protein ACTSPD_07695 [Promethearchaeota archaeon]
MSSDSAKDNTFITKKKIELSTTELFLNSMKNPVIDHFFNPIIKLLTQDRYLNLLYNFRESRFRKIFSFFLDILFAKIEKKLNITEELRKCMFGNKGSAGKRSACAHLLSPILRRYLIGWKERQKNKIYIPQTIKKVGQIPNLWKNWKRLREKICPNFNLNFNPKKDKTIFILPYDSMTPRERINRLVEFKETEKELIGL